MNATKPALPNSYSDSNVTIVISEELMKELNDRDKTLQQREKELEAKQKTFLDEKTFWDQHMCARKEQLQRQFERDKVQFEEALVDATQRDLNQLVEEYESHRRALLAVIAVFHLKCIAFDISLFIQGHSKEATNKAVRRTPGRVPRARSTSTPTVSANMSRCHKVIPVFLCWMTREMEQLERRYLSKLQNQPISPSPSSVQAEKCESAKALDGSNRCILEKMDGTPSKSHARSIFISILTFEAVSFIGKHACFIASNVCTS